MENYKQLLIKVYGIVQGVGFRPFVSNLAVSQGVSGSVCNKGPYVEIIAESGEQQLAAFLHLLKTQAPPRAVIVRIETEVQVPVGHEGFVILQSEGSSDDLPGELFVSPDIAICEACKAELYDPQNPRYLHPFINCTDCGPRLSILDRMPYDRERTSMGAFEMCSLCGQEYRDPQNRRYHAQPVCCNECGPKVRLLEPPIGGDAIKRTRAVLRQGGIAAVKGIGGFHLCCDAADPVAVSRLRRLKNRPFKPFAVMAKNLEVLRRECVVDDEIIGYIDSPQKPIAILPKRKGRHTCSNVAPKNPKLGIMLPYAPLQLLLFDYPGDDAPFPDCLVMTSGNISGAPICKDDAEARAQLAGMCDCILTHDREIRMRADDTVMTFYENQPYMLRRSRGYSPLPVTLPHKTGRKVLAVGGELKNHFCLASGDQLYLSPYIGNMSEARSIEAFDEGRERLTRLLNISPELVACDMHPLYNTTAYAKGLGLPVLEVQHHAAHIASCMAENGAAREEKVIGVAFDGTGYGTDGTIWGGEFLLAGYQGFKRLGCLKPFTLAGGDLAALEGIRPAISLLYDAFGRDEKLLKKKAAALYLCDERLTDGILAMMKSGINCVPTSSAGRLFDAVSALLGIRHSSTFDGEAAMALEYAAGHCESPVKVDFTPQLLTDTPSNGVFAIETANMIQYVTEHSIMGEPAVNLARAFHEIMARSVLAGCMRCRELTGVNTVALSGGVFANLLLLSLCDERLRGAHFKVYRHSLVPPSDGGLALGQAAIAMHTEIS